MLLEEKHNNVEIKLLNKNYQKQHNHQRNEWIYNMKEKKHIAKMPINYELNI